MGRRLKAALPVVLGVLLLGALVVGPGVARADSDGEGSDEITHLSLEGFVDAPPSGAGGSLPLPLAPGAPPVIVTLTFGVPAVQVLVTISPETRIRGETGLPTPITLVDGDRVKIDVRVVGNTLQARRLRLEEFPELKLRGLAQGIPGGSVPLPLAAGTVVDFNIALGGSTVTLPVRVTSFTKIEDGSFTLNNGDAVEVKALVNDFLIVATKIEREDEEEEEDDD
jgi:hypothetical protein